MSSYDKDIVQSMDKMISIMHQMHDYIIRDKSITYQYQIFSEHIKTMKKYIANFSRIMEEKLLSWNEFSTNKFFIEKVECIEEITKRIIKFNNKYFIDEPSVLIDLFVNIEISSDETIEQLTKMTIKQKDIRNNIESLLNFINDNSKIISDSIAIQFKHSRHLTMTVIKGEHAITSV